MVDTPLAVSDEDEPESQAPPPSTILPSGDMTITPSGEVVLDGIDCPTCGTQMNCASCDPPPTPTDDEVAQGDVLQALRTIRKVWREAPLSERMGLGNLINGELAELTSSDDGEGEW